MWLVQHKFQSVTPNPFQDRVRIPLQEQLISHGIIERNIDDAIVIWNEMAQAYKIDPMQLRVDDKIADIIRRDWFGDSGLSIEAKLTAIGAAPMPSDATLGDLMRLLLKQQNS